MSGLMSKRRTFVSLSPTASLELPRLTLSSRRSGAAPRQPRQQPSSGFPHRVLVVLLVLVPRWFLRGRGIKRISSAEAAHAPDRDHALLIGGPAAIGAATVASPVVGTPRIINLRTRIGRNAARGHNKRNNEPNCFYPLHRTSPSDFSVVVGINTAFCSLIQARRPNFRIRRSNT